MCCASESLGGIRSYAHVCEATTTKKIIFRFSKEQLFLYTLHTTTNRMILLANNKSCPLEYLKGILCHPVCDVVMGWKEMEVEQQLGDMQGIKSCVCKCMHQCFYVWYHILLQSNRMMMTQQHQRRLWHGN